MLNTTLHFPCFEQLWRFKVMVHSKGSLTLFTRLNVLAADLLPEEIQLACTQCSATVIRKQGPGLVIELQPNPLKEVI